MKNIIITDNLYNETSLIVCVDSVTFGDLKKFLNKVVGKGENVVSDIFELKDEEIQYYNIDGRVYITENNLDMFRKVIA